MSKIYVYVLDTFADWEAGYILAELNSKRFFKKDAREIEVILVGNSLESITTMGGFNIKVDTLASDIEVSDDNALILIGANTWNDKKNNLVIEKAKEFFNTKGLVAAICGATVKLADTGILDKRLHTSNGAGFLEMFSSNYKGTKNFVDKKAIRDENIITASSCGSLEFAREIIDYLDVFKKETLYAWYDYFKEGSANDFYRIMESIK